MVEKTFTTKNNNNNKKKNEIKNVKSMKLINKKMTGGDNIFEASINLIMSSIDLGGQLFKTVDGVMNMPTDLKKGMKAADLNAPAQAAPAPKQQMPNKELNDVKDVPIR